MTLEEKEQWKSGKQRLINEGKVKVLRTFTKFDELCFKLYLMRQRLQHIERKNQVIDLDFMQAAIKEYLKK